MARPSLSAAEVNVTKVLRNGKEGLLFGTKREVGWKNSVDDTVRIDVARVKRAEWKDGHLTIRHGDTPDKDDAGGELDALELFEVEGVLPAYVGQLRTYFDKVCGVFLHRHTAVATGAELDLAIRAAEDAACRVNNTAMGSVARMTRELNLMETLEDVGNKLEQLTRGDKQVLSDVMGANECERIGRMRLILEQCDVRLCAGDSRWLQLYHNSATVQNVLKEFGTYRVWTAAQAKDIWLSRVASVVPTDDEARTVKMDTGSNDESEDEGSDEVVQDNDLNLDVDAVALAQVVNDAEPVIKIEVGRKSFTVPLSAVQACDFWDVMKVAADGVQSNKLLRKGRTVIGLTSSGKTLDEKNWIAVRRKLKPDDAIQVVTLATRTRRCNWKVLIGCAVVGSIAGLAYYYFKPGLQEEEGGIATKIERTETYWQNMDGKLLDVVKGYILGHGTSLLQQEVENIVRVTIDIHKVRDEVSSEEAEQWKASMEKVFQEQRVVEIVAAAHAVRLLVNDLASIRKSVKDAPKGAEPAGNLASVAPEQVEHLVTLAKECMFAFVTRDGTVEIRHPEGPRQRSDHDALVAEYTRPIKGAWVALKGQAGDDFYGVFRLLATYDLTLCKALFFTLFHKTRRENQRLIDTFQGESAAKFRGLMSEVLLEFGLSVHLKEVGDGGGTATETPGTYRVRQRGAPLAALVFPVGAVMLMLLAGVTTRRRASAGRAVRPGSDGLELALASP